MKEKKAPKQVLLGQVVKKYVVNNVPLESVYTVICVKIIFLKSHPKV
jgi:hypothetical protein